MPEMNGLAKCAAVVSQLAVRAPSSVLQVAAEKEGLVIDFDGMVPGRGAAWRLLVELRGPCSGLGTSKPHTSLWVPQASKSSPPPGDSPTLDDIRNHDTTSFKQYFAQPGNEGFVYGTNAIPAITTRANVTEQADNTAAMPIPFETLIPYGIIIAVSSRRAAAPLDPGR